MPVGNATGIFVSIACSFKMRLNRKPIYALVKNERKRWLSIDVFYHGNTEDTEKYTTMFRVLCASGAGY